MSYYLTFQTCFAFCPILKGEFPFAADTAEAFHLTRGVLLILGQPATGDHVVIGAAVTEVIWKTELQV